MKITVEATVSLEEVLAEASLSDVLDALDMDEVLHEIDKDTMVSFVVSNYASSVLSDMDDYEVVRHVSRNISMGSLIEDLDADDRSELLRVLVEGLDASDKSDLVRVLTEEDEPDAPKLSADQWDLIKQDLKIVVKLRDLFGGPVGETLARHEQAIVDLINNHFPS